MINKIKNSVTFLVLMVFATGSQAQNLENYLQTAAERNPRVQSSYAQFEAAMQRAPQVSSLPDPTLTMSAFGRMIETRLGAQEARFTFMQMFPWFGTLKAKEDASNLMAEAAFQEYLDIRNTVFFEVKSVYAELYALYKNIQFKEENLNILDSYRELALSGFRGGNAPMVNVVKIDIQRDASAIEIELLQDLIKPLETRFNLLLNRDPRETVAVQDTLLLQNSSLLLDTTTGFEDHPSIAALKKQKSSYEMQETVAQKEGMPMLGLGVDYSIISPRTDANPPMNGQDAVMPMLSVSLPIFRKKYKAARKEAEFMGKSIQWQQEAQINELLGSYENAVYELKKAEKLITLYDRQIESSAQANTLLISAFSNATGNFEEVLQMNQDVLSYKIEKIEALKNGIIAQARLEYIFSKNEYNEN